MSAEQSQVEQTPIAPAPAPEAPAAPATPAPEPPKPTKDNRRDTLLHAMKNPTARGAHATQQPRNPVGQFAGPPAGTPPSPAVQRPAMPKGLKAELQSHWDGAHVDLLNDIIRRENDYTKG